MSNRSPWRPNRRLVLEGEEPANEPKIKPKQTESRYSSFHLFFSLLVTNSTVMRLSFFFHTFPLDFDILNNNKDYPWTSLLLILNLKSSHNGAAFLNVSLLEAVSQTLENIFNWLVLSNDSRVVQRTTADIGQTLGQSQRGSHVQFLVLSIDGHKLNSGARDPGILLSFLLGH